VIHGKYFFLVPSIVIWRGFSNWLKHLQCLESIFSVQILSIFPTDEITNSFRRYGHLVVDWPHKAESKSYFPPKGNDINDIISPVALIQLQMFNKSVTELLSSMPSAFENWKYDITVGIYLNESIVWMLFRASEAVVFCASDRSVSS